MNFYICAFVLALVGYLGYCIFAPVLLALRIDYAGRPGALVLRALRSLYAIAVVFVFVVWITSVAPSYFWWLLLVGMILLWITQFRPAR